MKHNRTYGSVVAAHSMRQPLILMAMIALALLAFASSAYAHAVTAGDKGYILEVRRHLAVIFIKETISYERL